MLFVSHRLSWQGTGTAIDTAIDSTIDPTAAEAKPGRPRKRDQRGLIVIKQAFQFVSERNCSGPPGIAQAPAEPPAFFKAIIYIKQETFGGPCA